MRDLEKIIHPASDADFTGYTDTKVYASAAATVTINGTEVSLIPGGTIEILVQTITGTLTNVFLLGRKRTIAPSVING